MAVGVLCLVLTVIVEFPGNTYWFSYIRKADRQTGGHTDVETCRQAQTDRQTVRQTDLQVNKLKDFILFFEGGEVDIG